VAFDFPTLQRFVKVEGCEGPAGEADAVAVRERDCFQVLPIGVTSQNALCLGFARIQALASNSA
jgi:hypothetical protein